MKLARHAIASVERKLFQSIRTARKIREDRSLIRAYNADKSENLFPPEDPPDEPLHKDMFEDDIMQYIFGKLKLNLIELLLIYEKLGMLEFTVILTDSFTLPEIETVFQNAFKMFFQLDISMVIQKTCKNYL